MTKFKPYVLRSLGQMVNSDFLVVHATFGGVRVLARPLVMPGLGHGVVDKVLLDEWLPGAVWPRYEPSKTPLQSVIDDIKMSMLTHGGTPEAVRLFNELAPLSRKELEVAKEKLAPKAAPKEAKGKAAKETKAPAAKKGNPEALEKARAAQKERSSATAGLKIAVLVKPADSGLRGGRLAKFEHVAKSKPKTVGDILGAEVTDDTGKVHVIDMGALRGMEKREHISIG